MKAITADSNQVAFCGLYCGACGKYLKDKCPGCSKNEKAGWCKIRICCIENHYATCAECKEFSDVKQCKKFNNFISKIFGLIFNSDRAACISRIKEAGREIYAREMADSKAQSIKRK
jgi:hypothetical protein